MNVSSLNTGQVKTLLCLTYLIELLPFAKILFSGLFSPVFCDIDLKCGIWICLGIIQIKFNFYCVWHTRYFLLFKFSFPHLSVVFQDVDIKFGVRICIDIIQHKFHFCNLWYILLIVMPLWNLFGAGRGHVLLKRNTYRMLVIVMARCIFSLSDSQAKSIKYQGVFEMKSRVKTWQVRGIWSQQLEHKQVPQWGTEPGVRKGKRFLLACHTRWKCSMETTHNRWRSSSV